MVATSVSRILRTMAGNRLIWLLPAAIFLLTGCSRHEPPVSEQQLLQQIGFNRPVVLNVQLNQPNDDFGNLASTQDGYLIALLTAAHLVLVQPYTAAAPWWHFTAQSGQLQGSTLALDAGARTVVSRIDQTYWSEGSDEFYAETIHYNISVTGPLASVPGAPKALQGSLRLVLRKDPAIGQWEVFADAQRGTKWAQDDDAVLRQALSDQGASFFAALTNDIQVSRRVAFDGIARNLDEQGVLARSDKDNSVLISRRQNLMYYVKPNSFSSLTPQAAAGYCADVRSRAGPGWRLPMPNELSAMVARDAFIDTPDHRLWGAAVQPSTVDVDLVVGVLAGNARDASGVWRDGYYSIASPGNVGTLPDVIENLGWPIIEISPGGLTTPNAVTMASQQRDVGNAALQAHDYRSGAPAILRIICVAALPTEARQPLAPSLAAEFCPKAIGNAEATSFLPQNAVLTSPQPDPAPKPDHYLCTATGPDRSGTAVTFTLVAKLRCEDMNAARCVQVTRITTSRGEVVWNALE